MFKKFHKLPQRKQFNLKPDELLEDINKVSGDEDQRNKLYICIEDKIPPQENKFTKIEDFLHRSDRLENLSETLIELSDELGALEKQLKLASCHLKDMVSETLVKHSS
ncbi:PREDICTED: uncharacterized protein LOC108561855 [Nicrophorus vespilloides]|uniref:Uncharacterized protein LOC108561855 n=1 Tax=Nicrophorus vespilloides TaxID=110193 RepID=A0ABM1MLJ0_NICVS|nr:PREDICTED: uncharacterized protein LOC108561855 [Nicrophorus vespilloides]